MEQYSLKKISPNRLCEVRDTHKIWNNPLLKACADGSLTRSEFNFFFSQYYLYSKNFTKLLTICMFKCDSDYYRSKLSENLFEEGGGKNSELRHAEIYRKFLTEHLKISLNNIHFEPYTELFFKQYLELCFNAESYECAAILSFGTEGIVSRLYSVIKNGLLKVGFTENDLTFFNIHIECDDDHALTLEEMALSHSDENHWLERCEKVVKKALDLRDTFFNYIYKSLQTHKFDDLIERISKYPKLISEDNKIYTEQLMNNVQSIYNINNLLYNNKDDNKNINFSVNRVLFNTDILDLRIVHIPSGSNNEFHSHAHETVFLILEGSGEVLIEESVIPVSVGDIVFIPRWFKHQTRNTSDKELKFFAVTDYGFTGRLSQNTESVYRQKKNFLV